VNWSAIATSTLASPFRRSSARAPWLGRPPRTGSPHHAAGHPVGPGRVGVLAPQCANITGHVYALNLATGATRWTRQPDAAGYWASPTISQGTIHITAKDGQLLTFALAGANR